MTEPQRQKSEGQKVLAVSEACCKVGTQSSKDTLGQSRAEIDVIIVPRSAIAIGPIAFCLSDRRQADVDCRVEPLMTSSYR